MLVDEGAGGLHQKRPRLSITIIIVSDFGAKSYEGGGGVIPYPDKTFEKNGDSYLSNNSSQRRELLLTTLHPLPAGSRIMGGQGKSQRHLGRGNPGQPPRWVCFRSMTAVSNAQPYLEEHTAAADKNLEYL